MAYQSIFQRYEIKYLLTREQKARMTAAMAPYMALDRYGRTTIRNVYFDTPNYRLIRLIRKSCASAATPRPSRAARYSWN